MYSLGLENRTGHKSSRLYVIMKGRRDFGGLEIRPMYGHTTTQHMVRPLYNYKGTSLGVSVRSVESFPGHGRDGLLVKRKKSTIGRTTDSCSP